MFRCTNSTLVTTGGILAAGLGPLGVFAGTKKYLCLVLLSFLDHWHVFSGVAAGSEAGQMTERGVNEFVEEEVCLSFGPQQIPSITRISGSLRLGNIWRHKEKSSS